MDLNITQRIIFKRFR